VLDEAGLTSVELDPGAYDCVVIVTAHSQLDYADIVDKAHVVVDLRNATGTDGRANSKVWTL
jgi:UDP-N-acetyl-D-mannosaminuronate dehydrogenase